jgi:hypothetical protein
VDGELALDETLIGGAGDRDGNPSDQSPDQPDLIRARLVGKRREPAAVGLGDALAREIKSDERVIGLHL